MRDEFEPEPAPDQTLRELAGMPSQRGFHLGLLFEHLEELGFLGHRRRLAPADPDLAWSHLIEFERRMWVHLDALDLGGASALACARELLVEGDEVEVIGAAFALAGLDHGRCLPEVIQRLRDAEPDTAAAVAAALSLSSEPGIPSAVLPLLEDAAASVRRCAAEILAGRPGEGPLPPAPRLEDDDAGALIAKIALVGAHGLERWHRAAGVLPLPGMRPAGGILTLLEGFLSHPDEEIRFAALSAALRLGSRPARERIRVLARGGDSRAIALVGICGSAADLELLVSATGSDASRRPALAAMGVLGNPAAAEQLLDTISGPDEAARPAAAEAFVLLTAAPPASAGLETAALKSWWHENRGRFADGRRYRGGIPFELSACLDTIRDPGRNVIDRAGAALEFTVRSGQPGPFAAGGPCAFQLRAVGEWKRWWTERKARIHPGTWLFAGEEI